MYIPLFGSCTGEFAPATPPESESGVGLVVHLLPSWRVDNVVEFNTMC